MRARRRRGRPRSGTCTPLADLVVVVVRRHDAITEPGVAALPDELGVPEQVEVGLRLHLAADESLEIALRVAEAERGVQARCLHQVDGEVARAGDLTDQEE